MSNGAKKNQESSAVLAEAEGNQAQVYAAQSEVTERICLPSGTAIFNETISVSEPGWQHVVAAAFRTLKD